MDEPNQSSAVALIGFQGGDSQSLESALSQVTETPCHSFDNYQDFESYGRSNNYQISICCLNDQLELLSQIVRKPDIPFVVLTDHFNANRACVWVEHGAVSVYDCEKHSDNEIAKLIVAHTKRSTSETGIGNRNFENSESKVAVIEWDSELLIRHWSPEAEKLLGICDEDAQGRRIGDWLFPGRDMLSIFEGLANLSEVNFGSFKSFCRTRCGDGSCLRTHWRITPLRDESHITKSFIGVFKPVAAAREILKNHNSDSIDDLTSIAEEAIEGTWDHDLGEDRLFWSPNIYKHLGINYHDVSPSIRYFLDRVHRDDRRKLRRAYKDCAQGRCKSFSIIYRLQDRSGSWRYFHGKAKTKHTDSQERRIVATNLDITHYITSTEELKFAKVTVDNSPSGIFWVNEQGSAIYCNKAVERILGYSHNEFINTELSKIDPKFTYSKPRSDVQALEQFHTEETLFIDKSGKPIEVEVEHKYVDTNDETVLVVYFRNISRRTSAERRVFELNKQLERRVENRTQQLESANNKLKSEIVERQKAEASNLAQRRFLSKVLENLPVGVYVKDAEKGFSLSVWNGEMERLFQLSKEDAVGRKIEDIFEDRKLVEVLGELKKMEVHSRAIVPRQKNASDSKTPFIADITRTPIYGSDGEVIALVGIVKDVTERINSENRLISAFNELEVSKAKLEQSNLEIRKGIEKAKKLAIAAQASSKAKSFFMSNISHELRTPLNSIIGLTHVLIEQTFGNLNEKQADLLNIIETSGKHLEGLITDILDLSKIELGKLRLNHSSVYPFEIGEVSLNMIRQEAEEKGIQVRLIASPNTPAFEADARRLRQILLNLLGNAVKFGKADSLVELEVQESANRECMTFKISDEGIGITKEDISKLFKPFSQLDTSLSRQFEGTGLGLAIVHKLVELHGGSLKVESEPNRGSVFSFTLPIKQSGASQEDGLAKISSHGINLSHSPFAIIVEENSHCACRMMELLQGIGHSDIASVTSNEIAVHFDTLSPSIVLVDLSTARNQGHDWISQAMSHPNWKKTKWISTSSLDTDEELRFSKRIGIAQFISKPLTPLAVQNCLNTP